ncbi:MAG: metal-dependent hydrolase [Sphingobacteriales bacterium]|nr:MAG: metal-dependent hydrolase [Sphingobacteriales bacterium]
MKLTYYGHACFSLEIGGKHILFDPFITGNELAKDIDIDNIKADFILVSHGHGDHVGDLVAIAKRTNALVVGAYEVMEWAGKQGISNTHPLNFGGKKDLGWGTVKFVPAWHSSVMPDGTYGANPGGFVVTTPEGNFYYSGDTCLMMDMQLIPRYAKLDFAILPIGDNFTMGVEDAIVAAEFVQCNKVIGVHYDTFGYIKIDHEAAVSQFKSAGMDLILPGIGETVSL